LHNYHGIRKLGQIKFPGIAVAAEQKAFFKQARYAQNEKLIQLTIISGDDAAVLEL